MIKISVSIINQHMHFTGEIPSHITEIEIHLKSNRNSPVSCMTDISPLNPQREKAINAFKKSPHNLLFPIMDIRPQSGCRMELILNNYSGEYCISPIYYKTPSSLSDKIIIPKEKLLNWENIIFLSDKSIKCLECNTILSKPVIAGQFEIECEMLSNKWQGIVEVYGKFKGGMQLLHKQELSSVEVLPIMKQEDSKDLSRERVINSLEKTINFLLNAKCCDDNSLSTGGMYLLYDLDCSSYRADHWNWTWGPAINLLLSSLNIKELEKSISSEKRIDYAKSMGDTILRFQMLDNSDPCYGIFMVRWQEVLSAPLEVCGYYSAADSGFCAKWGLSPLYSFTKDSKYKEAIIRLFDGVKQWYDKFVVPPADYFVDLKEFSPTTLDETMFIMGLFDVMKNQFNYTESVDIGNTMFEAICNALDLQDGYWSRALNRKENRNLGFCNDTKGHGWAMDGLLCAYEMDNSKTIYLEKACQTANVIINSQKPDGHWNNFFEVDDLEGGGIGEKSTALWSWLLYRLYSLTEDKKYLNGARLALDWCISHQYCGDDSNAYGGIIAVSEQSGIIYRPYFQIACTYASSFFGLAAIEEIKLQSKTN